MLVVEIPHTAIWLSCGCFSTLQEEYGRRAGSANTAVTLARTTIGGGDVTSASCSRDPVLSFESHEDGSQTITHQVNGGYQLFVARADTRCLGSIDPWPRGPVFGWPETRSPQGRKSPIGARSLLQGNGGGGFGCTSSGRLSLDGGRQSVPRARGTKSLAQRYLCFPFLPPRRR